VLELAEKALDLVALAIGGLAEAGLPFAVGLGGYIARRALGLDQVADAVCIISLVGEHDRARLKAVEQVVSGRSVVRLARCQAEPDRETLPIDDRWDCQKFRMWAGIMGKKEPQYVTTQRAYDTQ